MRRDGEVNMELEDFADEPVGVAVAASTVVFSPQVRRALRRGTVYGVAGVLAVSDAVAGFVRGARRGARNGAGREAGAPGEEEVEGAEGEPAQRTPRARPGTRGAARRKGREGER